MVTPDPTFWLLASIAAMCVGLGKGGVPAIAMIAVPLLALKIPVVTAAGLLLPVYIASDVIALFAYRKHFNWPVLKLGILGMTVGVLIGWATAHILYEWGITLLIGIMGVLFSIHLISSELSGKNQRPKNLSTKKGLFWSAVSGFTSFVSHSGAPPWQIFTLPLRLPKREFIGTSVIAFSYVNILKLAPYYALGHISIISLEITFYLIIIAAFTVYFGLKVIEKIPEHIFYKIMIWALMLVSAKLIWNGLRVGLFSVN